MAVLNFQQPLPPQFHFGSVDHPAVLVPHFKLLPVQLHL